MLNNSQIGLIVIFLSYVVILAGGCCQNEGFLGSITAVPNYLSQIPAMEILPFLFLGFVLYLAGVQLLGVQDCTGGLASAVDKAVVVVTGNTFNEAVPVMEKEDINMDGGDQVSEPFMKTNNAQLEGVLQAAVPLS